MSSATQIVFFREEYKKPLGLAFGAFVEWSAINKVLFACKAPTSFRDERSSFSIAEPEYLDSDIPVAEFVEHVSEGICVTIVVCECTLLDRITAAIQDSIPSGVRGPYLPTELHIHLGQHEWVDYADTAEGTHVATTDLSLAFWGYGTADKYTAFKRQIHDIPGLQEIRTLLRAITGKMGIDVTCDL